MEGALTSMAEAETAEVLAEARMADNCGEEEEHAADTDTMDEAEDKVMTEVEDVVDGSVVGNKEMGTVDVVDEDKDRKKLAAEEPTPKGWEELGVAVAVAEVVDPMVAAMVAEEVVARTNAMEQAEAEAEVVLGLENSYWEAEHPKEEEEELAGVVEHPKGSVAAAAVVVVRPMG